MYPSISAEFAQHHCGQRANEFLGGVAGALTALARCTNASKMRTEQIDISK
jgi:hypothetical protein